MGAFHQFCHAELELSIIRTFEDGENKARNISALTYLHVGYCLNSVK
jgi:hypothetical protein